MFSSHSHEGPVKAFEYVTFGSFRRQFFGLSLPFTTSFPDVTSDLNISQGRVAHLRDGLVGHFRG
jgi:hypothetical protein